MKRSTHLVAAAAGCDRQAPLRLSKLGMALGVALALSLIHI